ncbi:hypothetical protein [Thermomonas fusca]|uniref:hypothetical protein n=1 Tax=Thermomonas fusca TaxID=215690 RepID=UPI000407DF73|nr:hypothetical protein [Thermomonas fusca]
MAERFVISYEYGQLVEGYNAASDALRWERLNAGTGLHNAHVIATFAAEASEWQAAMRRCPVFLGQAA